MDIDDENDEEVEDTGFNQNSQNNDYSEFDNKISTQSYLNDRTFVVKDNNAIVVYKTDNNQNDNQLELLNSIPPIKTYDGNNINIDNAQMFMSDVSLLLLDKSHYNRAEDTIYKYDLNKMKVVEEYADPKTKDISSIATESRYGNMTDNPIIVGVNSNSIFTIDPRLNSKNNNIAAKREYAKGTKALFKSLCTSSNGNVIVGSVDGKIRLYKNNIHSKTSAATALPGFGDPIKSVDVTNDGNYLLVTCNNYLMVINSKATLENGTVIDGFSQSITKNVKSIKLQINPNDIDRYNLYNCFFTPARFNVGKSITETTIVTSIGDYLVIWDFSAIKKGKKNYKIKKMNQKIKNNEFMFDKDELIVTMDKNVGLQHKFK